MLPLLGVLFAFKAWQVDDGAVNHAALIQGWNQQAFEQGQAVFQESCAQCHGSNGDNPPNPQAAAFVRDTLKNGSDPYAMWQTLTQGFGQMQPQTWLSPRQRYQVIHYIREQFFKRSNPSQYTSVTQDYLEKLPRPANQQKTNKRAAMDYGPALTYELASTRSSLILPISGNLGLYYDLHTMRAPGAWTNGFTALDETHHTEYKGGKRGRIVGEKLGIGPLQWAYNGSFKDPRKGVGKQGPMPQEALQLQGHYLHGEQVILSYSVAGRKVLDMPEAAGINQQLAVAHTLWIGPGKEELMLLVGQRKSSRQSHLQKISGQPVEKNAGSARKHLAVVGTDTTAAAGLVGDAKGFRWNVGNKGRLVLKVPPSEKARVVKLFRAASPNQSVLIKNLSELVSSASVTNPQQLTDGGPRRWRDTLTTTGELGTAKKAYVVDKLQVPLDNPWGSWMRLSGFDFFADGRAAVATLNGDIWTVSGIDKDLDTLRWRRYATGLYEPLGLKVIKGKVYVVGRDRITRLHDYNADGEADFYENFYAFDHVSNGYHAFTFGVDTDSKGNIYVVKSGRKTDDPIPGAVLKIAPDGSSSEVIATGFRHPNGMTVGPNDQVFVSDNQGEWTPASKVSRIRKGGFYGYMGWEDNKVSRDTFQRPVFWLPQEADNSSGGQVWATDRQWGPLAGKMIHTSYGKGRAFYVLTQEVGEKLQGAVVPFSWQFPAGLMRARVHPKDGQVYFIGQRGWGTEAAKTDGLLARIRYTEQPAYLLTGAKVTATGLQLEFSSALDPSVATDPHRYKLTQWNYKWTKNYGSAHYRPDSSGKEGEQPVRVASAKLSKDGQTVRLLLDEHRSVDQMKLVFNLKAADGTSIKQTIYWTIKTVPTR